MQDITQCKECGHENPKKFMGKEYTSHAPNCSQEIKQQQTMEDRLRNWYKEWLYGDYGFDFNEYLISKVKSEISLAVAQERERITKIIDNQPNATRNEVDNEKVICSEELLNLINNK